jgi:hypothetical protein
MPADDILDHTFFSDEAWIHLDGYVNSQNYRIWSSENPHPTVETTLHLIKVGVWMAMSRQRIIGPYFFNFTVNSERYVNNILEPFVNELDDQECNTVISNRTLPQRTQRLTQCATCANSLERE